VHYSDIILTDQGEYATIRLPKEINQIKMSIDKMIKKDFQRLGSPEKYGKLSLNCPF